MMLVSNAGFTSYTEKQKFKQRLYLSMAFMTSNLFPSSNTAITPYLGGGVGISRNKMGTIVQNDNGVPDGSYC
jgi:hypothetical protein